MSLAQISPHKKKLFVQEQINVTSIGLQSGTTFCFGLGNNFEIGANWDLILHLKMAFIYFQILSTTKRNQEPSL